MPTSDNPESSLPTGFAGSYDDYVDKPLNLHDLLVSHPAATFIFRISGIELAPFGIFAGDIAVVDRSLVPRHLDFVLCVIAGEFVVQAWHAPDAAVMCCDDTASTNNEQEMIGVITSIVRQFRRG